MPRCYTDGVFTLPQITSLEKEMGAELKESFVRESRQVWKADEATVAVSNEYNVLWKKLPDDNGELRHYIGFPHDTASRRAAYDVMGSYHELALAFTLRRL